MPEELWTESLTDIEAAGAAGITKDFNIPGGAGTVLVSIFTDDADPVAADAQLSIDGLLLNHRGNVVDDDAGGNGRIVFYNNAGSSGKSGTTGPYKLLDSPDGNVMAADFSLIGSSHGRACVCGEAFRLRLRGDEGTSSWAAGQVHLKVSVLPGVLSGTGL